MSRPVAFTTFVDRVSDMRLTPAQALLCRACFDGLEPHELGWEPRETVRALFGTMDDVPPLARTVVTWVKGARVGGTLLCSLRLLHLGLTLPLPKLAPGEKPFAMISGPELRLARQPLSYVHGQALDCPEIAERVENVTADGFDLLRDDGLSVAFACLPASRGGSALRGRTLVGGLMTEGAFFRDENSVVNDQEVFRAMLPRIAPGGQLLIESTPFAEMGLLHQLWEQNYGKPTSALVAHCPTLLMRPDARTRAIVDQERQRDPDNAAREFDAQFMTAGAGLFLDPSTIDEAIDRTLTLPAAVDDSATIGEGVDLGLVNDASAKVTAARRDEIVSLASIVELRPQPGAPLQLSRVVETFADDSRRFRSSSWMADGWAREPAREWTLRHAISIVAAPEGQAGKAQTYLHLRKLLTEHRLRLPNHPRLIAQLKSIVSKPTPGGGLAISMPRGRGVGGHGDIVSALVLAVWKVSAGGGFSGPRMGTKPLFAF